MNIENLLDKYESVEELRIFCQSQYKQIIALTKKNKELEEKLAGKSQVPDMTKAGAGLPPAGYKLDLTGKEDSKVISEIQLHMLKEAAFGRELTTDEAKRVEIYHRILTGDTSKDKPIKAKAEVVDSADLLKLVESK